MRLNCQEAIESYIASLKEGFSCIPTENKLRIITPYLYPDNDLIEIFVEELPSGQIRVTDLAETLRHLHSRGFDVFESPKRKFMVETIASRTGVEIFQGQLVKIGDVSQLGTILFDVIVTARGVSDLIYTSKTFEPATFLEEVEGFLKNSQIPVEPRVKLLGISGRSYTIHFRVTIGRPRFLQTLSPVAVAGLKPKVDATVRMWVDINHELTPEQKVTILNDVDFEWRPYDINILGRLSTVKYWTRKEDLLTTLRTPIR
jgi:hypothetical protein